MEDSSDTLLLHVGTSSSSLKLLSWFGSKSSSAAMLSISRLTAPRDGSLSLVLARGWIFRAELLRPSGAETSETRVQGDDGLTGGAHSFSFFFFAASLLSLLGAEGLGLGPGFWVRGRAELEEVEEEELWLVEVETDVETGMEVWLAVVVASWRNILSLRRRFQPSSSLRPQRLQLEFRSKLIRRGVRDWGRGLGKGLRLIGKESSLLVGLGWLRRRVAGGSRGSSGAERFP